MSHAKTVGDHAIVRHVVKAPPVADGKGSYFLDYHYFYRVKNKDASTDVLQDFPASRIQVFPRFAQLKVTDKDGNAFPGFRSEERRVGKECRFMRTSCA